MGPPDDKLWAWESIAIVTSPTANSGSFIMFVDHAAIGIPKGPSRPGCASLAKRTWLSNFMW